MLNRTNQVSLKKALRRCEGFSLLEMMVVMALVGIMSGYASYRLSEMDNPAENSAAQVMTFMKKSRAKALATTYAVRVRPKSNSTELETHYATSCTASTFTLDSSLTMKLPRTATFQSNTWSLCFTPRGTLTTSNTVVLVDPKRSVSVQIAMGGGMRKL
jgi:prepilin-type N-terminal cleavage/methylation domain-containing protein